MKTAWQTRAGRRMGSAQLERRFAEALLRLEQMGVSVPSAGRHQQSLDTLAEWNSSSSPVDLQDEPALRKIGEAHRTAWETYLIVFAAYQRTLKRHRGQETLFTPERFRKLMKGPFIGEGRDTEPRNVQFELYLGARLELGGIEVRGGEPDLKFLYGYEWVGLAAKRIQSLKGSQIQKNIQDAANQIERSGCRGWVAVSLDSRFEGVDVHESEPDKLARFGSLFDSTNAGIARQERKPGVLGLMAFGYADGWSPSPDPATPPRLWIDEPHRWLHWNDDPGAVLLFNDFSEGWSGRFQRNRERMMDADFRGIL